MHPPIQRHPAPSLLNPCLSLLPWALRAARCHYAVALSVSGCVWLCASAAREGSHQCLCLLRSCGCSLDPRTSHAHRVALRAQEKTGADVAAILDKRRCATANTPAALLRLPPVRCECGWGLEAVAGAGRQRFLGGAACRPLPSHPQRAEPPRVVRSGDAEELSAPKWNFLASKLAEKYGQHPLDVLAAKIDRDFDFDDESTYAGSEVSRTSARTHAAGPCVLCLVLGRV